MKMAFWKIVFRVLVALIIGAMAGLLFQAVLPKEEARLLGIGVTIAELVGSLATAQHGAGHGLRMMMRMGEVLLAWPLAAWVLMWAGVDHPGVRIGVAAAIASAVGMGAARHGNGRESARLVAVIIAVAIPCYVVLSAVASGDARSLIAACLACAVAPMTASVAHVWPDARRGQFVAASVVCAASSLAVFVRGFV